MKTSCLAAVICLLSTACFAAEETMLLALVEVTVDGTAAQRQRAVFKSNEDTPRTFVIPLWFSPDKVGKNERNIIMLIRQFPQHPPVRTGHGRTSKPKGILSFTVPKEDPVGSVPEWELAQLSVKEEAEQ